MITAGILAKGLTAKPAIDGRLAHLYDRSASANARDIG
jgi:hypothetical protein